MPDPKGPEEGSTKGTKTKKGEKGIPQALGLTIPSLRLSLTSEKLPSLQKKREPLSIPAQGFSLRKRRLPTLPLLRSTIGVVGLNFSVRNGKRWNPNAITT